MIQSKTRLYDTRNPQIVTIIKTMLPCNSEKLYMEHGGRAPRILKLYTTVILLHAAVLHSRELQARITLS
jgi:hypothetical protein